MNRTVYRIENPIHNHGMWYDKRGTFDPIIQRLCPNGIAKDFPMPLNIYLHRKDGLVWNSAGKSIENMNQWFSPEDALRLCNSGFRLYKFDVTLYQELPMEILFCREGILSQEEIPLELVWDINQKSMNTITVSIKEKSNAVSRIVSGSYLVKFVDPDKEYPVNYTIKQDGTKVHKPQMLIGADLTENQIVELFSKQLL